MRRPEQETAAIRVGSPHGAGAALVHQAGSFAKRMQERKGNHAGPARQDRNRQGQDSAPCWLYSTGAALAQSVCWAELDNASCRILRLGVENPDSFPEEGASLAWPASLVNL